MGTIPTALNGSGPHAATPTLLTKNQQDLLKDLLRPNATVEAVIPNNAAPEEVWRTLEACVRGLNLLEERVCRLHPIIGRILLLFQEKPPLYRSLGYNTYTEFMQRGVYDTLGLHRASAYQGKLVARDWPQIGPDLYSQIGPKKMAILSKVTKGKSSNAAEWLEKAVSMKVEDLRQHVEEMGLITVGETNAVTITIQTNRAVSKHFKQVFNDGRVHSVVGSADWGKILEAMLEECWRCWIVDAEKGAHAEA